MTYEFHLDKPLPAYMKDAINIVQCSEKKKDYIYKISFETSIEHEEFCEIIYSILDINGSEEEAS